MQKRYPFQQKPSSSFNAPGITAPMFKSVLAILFQHLESFRTWNIDKFLFLDLLENPGFDQSSPADAHSSHWRKLLSHSLVIVVRQNVTRTKEGNRCSSLGTLFYVRPVCEFCVSLLSGPAMKLKPKKIVIF